MANLVLDTEMLDDVGTWSRNDSPTVTADFYSPPSTAAPGANGAEKVEDTDGLTLFSNLTQNITIPNDSNSYVCSCFMRKDAVTTRFPELRLLFVNGTLLVYGLQLNTSTGAAAADPDWTVPISSGVVDVDANWWRPWFQGANNNTGNTIAEIAIYPAITDAGLGTTAHASAVGSIGVWGVNLTQSTVLLPYEPNPDYRQILWLPQGHSAGRAPTIVLASGMST